MIALTSTRRYPSSYVEIQTLLIIGTNDVQGVTICSTIQEGEYNISCSYVSGCNHSGCKYLLGGSDGVVIDGTIMGDEYHTQKVSNIRDYNQITVYDVDDIVVQNGSFDASRDVASCIPTTGKYSGIVNSIWCL